MYLGGGKYQISRNIKDVSRRRQISRNIKNIFKNIKDNSRRRKISRNIENQRSKTAAD